LETFKLLSSSNPVIRTLADYELFLNNALSINPKLKYDGYFFGAFTTILYDIKTIIQDISNSKSTYNFSFLPLILNYISLSNINLNDDHKITDDEVCNILKDESNSIIVLDTINKLENILFIQLDIIGFFFF
jgi:hypothetical protein